MGDPRGVVRTLPAREEGGPDEMDLPAVLVEALVDRWL